MMILKQKSGVIIALLMLFLNSCNSMHDSGLDTILDGGGCEYEDFSDIFKVDNIKIIGDSIDEILFVSILDSDYQLGIYQDEVGRYMKGISREIINDTTQLFIITGERIISGSCTPINIYDIKVEQ